MLADTGDDVNENSIVVMFRYRAFRELFMGDAGEASEARLLALCHPEQRRGAATDQTASPGLLSARAAQYSHMRSSARGLKISFDIDAISASVR